MRIVQLSVSTDGSGDGSDASAEYKGYVLCWDRDFAGGGGAGGGGDGVGVGDLMSRRMRIA